MEEEKRVPSLLLNILLAQVDETMGHRSLIMLLRQAGLDEYVDQLPPMNETPSIAVADYSDLLANVHDLFGARGSRPIFLRAGRLGAGSERSGDPRTAQSAGDRVGSTVCPAMDHSQAGAARHSARNPYQVGRVSASLATAAVRA